MESPETLLNIVIEYITSNLIDICSLHRCPEDESLKLVFRDPNAFVASNVGNLLLEKIDQNGELDDLVMTLFDPSVIHLTKLSVHDASHLTYSSLKILKYYSLTSIELCGLRNISVDDLILSLSDYTLNNLVSLNLHGSLFYCNSTRTCEENTEKSELHHSNLLLRKSNLWGENVVSLPSDLSSFQSLDITAYDKLCKLESIRVLNLSKTVIESSSLFKICRTFHMLVSLDISGIPRITSIKYLKYCKDSLKSLNLFNLEIWDMKETLEVLLELQNLVHLDMSQFHGIHIWPFSNSVVPDLLKKPNFVPNATSVDISGQVSVNSWNVLPFLMNHPNLSFLGLMGLDLDIGKVLGLLPSQCIVTSFASVDHLLNGLQRYSKGMLHINDILMTMKDLLANLQSPRPDIIQMIIAIMNEHKFPYFVQYRALTCLHYLIRGSLEKSIHPGILKRVVSLTLAAMNEFPDDLRIQNQALRILCSDFLFENVNFDKTLCLKSVMKCFLQSNDALSNRMCVALCSYSSVEINFIDVFSQDVLNHYMKKLLKIARHMVRSGVDYELMCTLTALLNLTGESSAFCELFLVERGLEFYQEIIRRFSQKTEIIAEILALLNNISSVQDLRKCFMKEKITMQLRNFLWSGNFDVSFYAAGILADLVCAEDNWRADMKLPREKVLYEIGVVVMNWEPPLEETSSYRSLKDFIPLLMAFDAPQVQMLAVWVLFHATSTNGSKYRPMIVKDGLDDKLRRLLLTPQTNEYTRRMAEDILKSLPDSPTEKMKPIDNTLIS